MRIIKALAYGWLGFMFIVWFGTLMPASFEHIDNAMQIREAAGESTFWLGYSAMALFLTGIGFGVFLIGKGGFIIYQTLYQTLLPPRPKTTDRVDNDGEDTPDGSCPDGADEEPAQKS